MNLQERSKAFIDELKLPISRFCELVGFSRTSFYRWQADDLKLKPETEEKIKSVLKRFNG